MKPNADTQLFVQRSLRYHAALSCNVAQFPTFPDPASFRNRLTEQDPKPLRAPYALLQDRNKFDRMNRQPRLLSRRLLPPDLIRYPAPDHAYPPAAPSCM